VVEGFDESFDELFEKVAVGVPCVPEKDAAFLRWRYGPGSPQFPVTVSGREGRGDPPRLRRSHGDLDGPGWLCARPYGAPGASRRGAGTAPGIGPFLSAGGGADRTVQVPRVCNLAPVERSAAFGFFYRKGRRNNLLVKFADRGLHEVANDTANWSYTLGDGEGSFWTR
jgi:hypothetical protein